MRGLAMYLRRLMRVSLLGIAVMGCPTLWAAPASAQAQNQPQNPPQNQNAPQSGILTLEFERLFEESAFGQRIANEIEAESAVLAAENRKIEAELAAEEQDLTARRSEMEADAFSVLANAFDEKVQLFRRTQDAKARDLGKRNETARGEFLRAVRPVLETLMSETGAGVVLERSNVFLSSNATDITDRAIERINAAIGDGSATHGVDEN